MSAPTKIDEREAIKLLVRWLPSGHTYMPRFTPDKWWENDLCAVTKAGFWTEFEVKLSRPDFLADKAKERREWVGRYPDAMISIENKHALLATTERGPARFYYCVQDGVATEADMPAWAGLLTFKWELYGDGNNGRWVMHLVRKAPLRHHRKDPQVIAGIYRAAWFRGISKLL